MCVVSDYGDLPLENHYQMILRKMPSFWTLAHLKNQFVKEEITGHIRESFEPKDNENTESVAEAKAVLGGRCVALNVSARRGERSKQ